MRFQLNKKTFNSKISRRIFITFVTCALLPVLIFAIFSYTQIINYLENQMLNNLRHATKTTSMFIYDRIAVLEDKMEFLIYLINNHSINNLRELDEGLYNTISKGFRNITFFKSPNEPQPIYNRPAVKSLKLSPDEFRHMSQGNTLIAEVTLPNFKNSILMLRQVDAKKDSKGILVCEIDLKALWNPNGIANLPLSTEICILNSSQKYLHSSDPWLKKKIGLFAAKSQVGTSGQFRFNANEKHYFSGYTGLFLRPNYRVDKWTIVLIKSKFDLLPIIDSFKKYSLLFCLLLFSVAIFLSTANIRKNLDPIDSLNEIAQRFSKKDFTYKVNIRSGDEFEKLGKAFNTAGQQLALYYEESKQTQKKLNNARKHLEKEVKKRTAELAKAKETALSSSKAKSEFLANMSHELRTPLNHVIGFTELVLSKEFGDLSETQEEYLNDVHGSAYHLLSLVNDILDISKVEAGKLEMNTTDVNLMDLLNNSLVMFKEKTLRHSIKTAINTNGIPSTITADERMLKQIMYNLLSNAVKFTPNGGNVTVSASSCYLSENNDPCENETTRSGIKISVSDTGIGLKPDDFSRIFNSFEQVENTASRKFMGTGLGLSLTKKLVEMHRGKIWVESEGNGKGATFIFCIPV